MRTTAILVLAAAALAIPASASASPGAGNGQFSTGPSCAVSCITSALIEPHTGSFGISVHTDTPARIFVGVQHLLQPEDSWIDWARSEPGRTSWANHLTGLQPDTTYKVTVSASDALSRTETRTTFFRPLAVQTAVPAGPGDVQSNVGCSQQCISAVRLAPDGTGAGVTVDTSVPAKVQVSVDDDAPGTIDGAPFFGSPEGSCSSGQFVNRRAGFVDGLVPGSNSHIVVRATDASGFTAYRHGISARRPGGRSWCSRAFACTTTGTRAPTAASCGSPGRSTRSTGPSCASRSARWSRATGSTSRAAGGSTSRRCPAA